MGSKKRRSRSSKGGKKGGKRRSRGSSKRKSKGKGAKGKRSRKKKGWKLFGNKSKKGKKSKGSRGKGTKGKNAGEKGASKTKLRKRNDRLIDAEGMSSLLDVPYPKHGKYANAIKRMDDRLNTLDPNYDEYFILGAERTYLCAEVVSADVTEELMVAWLFPEDSLLQEYYNDGQLTRRHLLAVTAKSNTVVDAAAKAAWDKKARGSLAIASGDHMKTFCLQVLFEIKENAIGGTGGNENEKKEGVAYHWEEDYRKKPNEESSTDEPWAVEEEPKKDKKKKANKKAKADKRDEPSEDEPEGEEEEEEEDEVEEDEDEDEDEEDEDEDEDEDDDEDEEDDEEDDEDGDSEEETS